MVRNWTICFILLTALVSACSSPAGQELDEESAAMDIAASMVGQTATPTIVLSTTPVPISTPTHKPTATDSPTPTKPSTATPIVTATPTIVPFAELSIRIGLDANASGKLDTAQFYCPANHNAIDAIPRYFPSAVDCIPGHIVSAPEPALEGFTVSTDINGKTISATTDATGIAVLHIPAGEMGDRYEITIRDPNEGTELAMKYYNIFLEEVVRPAQSIKGSITGRTYEIPEQILSRTNMRPLTQRIALTLGEEDEISFIGVTQGYQTSPHGHLRNWFDLNPNSGVLRYDGDTTVVYHPIGAGVNGTTDNHEGTDWHNDYGAFVISQTGGRIVYALPDAFDIGTEPGRSARVQNDEGETEQCTVYITDGHVSDILVTQWQTVLRGEIIGTIGQNGTDWPHDHSNLRYPCRSGEIQVDPFTDGTWTVAHLPILPLVSFEYETPYK